MNEKEKQAEQEFLNDVKDHKLGILCDQGVTRHLRFKKPGSIYYCFDLTTWLGHLCISGDMGTYVFQRTEDMFDFFRIGDEHKKIRINPHYWHQKLKADGVYAGAKCFSEESFIEEVKQQFDSYCKDNEETEEFKARSWKDIVDEFSSLDSLNQAHQLISDNLWATNELRGFADYLAEDYFEYSGEDYTYHFLWCLRAIVWGIKQYDLAKIR